MASFTFSLAGVGSSIDQTSYAGTSDDKLTYTGDDNIVWDRVNGERIRRGLPSLTAIGYPRPADETTNVDTSGSSQTFTVKAPPGMTREQAFAIFQQQQKAGSLVGLKPGDTISSASQAAAGLPGAIAQVTQSLSGIGGSITGALTGVLNKATASAQAIPSTDLLSSAKSVATKTLSTISAATKNIPVTNGINVADFARQAPALVPIGNMNATQVTAAVSQASKLVGQSSTVISDTKGLGQFGLDATQLERAGVIKPGTASTYLSQGQNNLTDVLNSPAVWTGKNGIDSVDKLLSSVPKQSLIQQDLMSSGLSTLKQFGVPVDKLNPQALAGAALNAAKSPADALAWAQGQGLPSSAKSTFDTVARDGAFAVNFSDTKISDAMAQAKPGTPAEDTVNRQTLDAAGTRVVGNDKIPPVSYSNAVPAVSSADIEKQFDEAADTYVAISNAFKTVASKTDRQRADTNSYYDDIETIQQLINDLEVLDSSMAGLIRRANNLTPPDSALVAKIEKAKSFVGKSIKLYEGAIESLRQFLATRTA